MNRTNTSGKSPSGKDILKRSFEKETSAEQHKENRERTSDEERRSMMGKPVDPNAATNTGTFPPGLPAGDIGDPGRMTPDAPAVDNRSGSSRNEPPSKK